MDLMATGQRERAELAVEELCGELDRASAVIDLDAVGSELPARQPAGA